MSETIQLRPVGHVRGGRAEPIDDSWGEVVASVELAPEFGPDALAGLDGFSHVEVVFVFHRVAESAVVTSARHPRGRADWPKVGIFAQRGKDRPNRIGVTVCKLRGISGTSLQVAGLDAIDGTPVLDIKPCMRGFLPREEVVEPTWASELMKGYWR
ncbi:MAG: SAM-dependent methyltransferase [Roseiarcus sp.]|jgi:tRNA-Thr(GGU) m(6)t(6)A37 methyltransferase TsaA